MLQQDVCRVRLVAFNPERFSQALAYLAATLTQRLGGAVAVDQLVYDSEDVRHRRLDVALALADIVDDRPDVVGLSWYSWNHRLVQHVARTLAVLLPRATLVVGGPQTRTVFEEELTSLPDGTVLVFGEGESAICDIVASVREHGGVPELPPGTGRVVAGAVERAPAPAGPVPLDGLPSPVLAGLLGEPAGRRLPSYFTTRGCVYQCSFCAWQDGLSERAFPLTRVLDELDVLATRPYEMIWFTDTIFGRDEQRGLAILDRLRRWPSPTTFGLELHAQYLTPRLADAVAAVRLDFATIGVQSLAPDVLKSTRRNPRTHKLFAALDLLYDRVPDRSTVHIDLIFGLPGQTLDECFDGVDTLVSRYPDATLFCSMLQLIAGTAFERLRGAPGWACLPPEGDYEVVATPTIQGDDVRRLRDLLVGLDAMAVARAAGQPRPRISAAHAETVGRAMRGGRFHHCPTAYRQELLTWADVPRGAQELLLAHAQPARVGGGD